MGDDDKRLSALSDARVTGYCAMRLPVRDVRRSVAFYCDVIGYTRTGQEGETEALIESAGGAGPALFLMNASENEFRHIHWEQWGELYTAFELLVDDLHALQRRLVEAGATSREPSYRGEYLTMGFFDPDGHFMFAVDGRGRYFSLRPEIEELLGRALTNCEVDQLQRACAATVAHDELSVIQSIISEARSQ
jgi:catechol 2,3-dioxygenase-like lactoylglutathione lyase family enzyme